MYLHDPRSAVFLPIDDDNWNITPEGQVRYNNLAAVTFRVRCTNEDSAWSPEESIRTSMYIPFFQTWVLGPVVRPDPVPIFPKSVE